MSSYKLPIELLKRIEESPNQQLTFEQNGYVVELALRPLKEESAPLSLFRLEPSGKKPTQAPIPPSKMKLQLLDDADFQLQPSALALEDPFSLPPTETQNHLKPIRKVNEALQTNNILPPLQPLDDFFDSSENNFPQASEESSPPKTLEDTQPDPEEAKSFENAFLDEEEGWLGKSQSSFRALRATDTPKILKILFNRLNTSLDQLNKLLPEKRGGLPPTQLAKAAGVSKVLERPIPFLADSPDAPNYHLVGQTRESVYVLLYQEEDSLHYTPIPHDGGEFQIVLVEGEELLSDEELTQLFKEGAKEATPEQAEATAKQVQQKLRQGKMTPPHLKKLALTEPTTARKKQKVDLSKAIPVNQRFLKRLNYNRSQDNEYLWDSRLQPGVSVFRYNIATLYQNNQRLIEGILLYIVERQQYLVFDRRTKRSVPLIPNGEQLIWLRHDETLA